MISFCLLFIYFVNQLTLIETKILLINDRAHSYSQSYRLVTSNDRIKRDSSNEQENLLLCDEQIYTKLYSCSQLNDCVSLSSCLGSIQCPLNKQSYGSLILNLLRLLGSDHCHNISEHSSCSHEKRTIILHNLLTHWTDERLNLHLEGETIDHEHYCKAVLDFVIEVEEEIRTHCSIYSRQVEAFLGNYLCSGKISSSSVDYLDEDKEFDFFQSNHTLSNTTEQTVYVNDHQYYNASYIVPKSGEIPLNFVADHQNQFIPIHALADRHRSAFSIHLKFDFPFYGHTINRILVGTGGFIYTGDLLHSALIGSTQYIAPFMANFDLSIGTNQSIIKYFDNSTHFICTWNQLYLQDQPDAGAFTFQAILQNTGAIYFNYLHIPQVTISTLHHAHRIGVSDAYMTQHTNQDQTIRVITLYDKLNLDREKIRNGVSIILTMDNTCNTFTDCNSCLANRGKRYNCSWCDEIEKCSDGHDRSRQQWVRAQCPRLASENVCPRSRPETSIDHNIFSSLPSIIHIDSNERYLSSALTPHSTFQTFRTIVFTLFLTVMILSVVSFVVAYVYAYRHPTSPMGMWLIEHRPSNYFARFKRFSNGNNDSN